MSRRALQTPDSQEICTHLTFDRGSDGTARILASPIREFTRVHTHRRLSHALQPPDRSASFINRPPGLHALNVVESAVLRGRKVDAGPHHHEFTLTGKIKIDINEIISKNSHSTCGKRADELRLYVPRHSGVVPALNHFHGCAGRLPSLQSWSSTTPLMSHTSAHEAANMASGSVATHRMMRAGSLEWEHRQYNLKRAAKRATAGDGLRDEHETADSTTGHIITTVLQRAASLQVEARQYAAKRSAKRERQARLSPRSPPNFLRRRAINLFNVLHVFR